MKKSEEQSAPRIGIIDATRGLAIILMVMHHFAYDLIMYDLIPGWLINNPVFNPIQMFFAGLFIFISGLSSYVSRNNLKRGAVIFAGGIAVTLVSYLFDNTAYVRFGILHFLGIAAIIYALIRKGLERIPRKLSLALIIAGFFVSLWVVSLSTGLTWLFPLGIMYGGFVSTDYFPLLPWFFVYLLGSWAGQPVFARQLPKRFYALSFPLFEKIGRKTLIIYLVHQPIVMGLTWLILLILPRV